MTDKQPSKVEEGATTGDVEDDVPPTAAKSAQERKAASAMASLDDDARPTTTDASSSPPSSRSNVDQEAVRQAMKNLEKVTGTGAGASAFAASKPRGQKNGPAPAAPRKNVKLDPADVTLLVQELEMSKLRATEFLREYDGDAVAALRAYVTTAG
ncbi:hypothetical protein GMORB2_1576 [Geosmithia morbida]|uniref:Nascent polypeptide-associated complex subunit alpha-like UBA domain-containing protein n=1 Tax=Geosmithia morbida TaxID=1094350 RepID=A0A9P4YSJ6_9HYPO|nr:uncharacterized protein GMORB2_1576 [Geosmithia morbida]KAF4121737.1 hypothetical protein GMORB2_1576 [Geosmithia morbida]